MPSSSKSTPPAKVDLDTISSKDHLVLWDQYVVAVLKGAIAFHGVASVGDDAIAHHAASVADTLVQLRQERAQAHVDQKESEKKAAKKATN